MRIDIIIIYKYLDFINYFNIKKMANVNDIMRILDIDTALFNKADNKIIFVGEQLFAKFQFAVRNSVFKSELNLIIVTFIIATLLFVLDPLGKKSRNENITPPPVEIV